MLRLYYGSNVCFDFPNFLYFKDKKDFGKGFYMTDNLKTATDWALRYRKRGISKEAYLYSAVVDLQQLRKLIKVHECRLDVPWLDFIIRNRNDRLFVPSEDLIIGPTADAHAQILIEDFCVYKGGLDADITSKKNLITNLHTENLAKQYCFRTELAISYLVNFQRRVL